MIEKMTDFFSARVDGYDEHMINDVEGCKEAYKVMADKLPNTCEHLLDLGCGTGLELEEIFKRYPNLKVCGIDLTQAMLDKLEQKYKEKSIDLKCGSYFDVDFGNGKYDCAISFQTMHHFTYDKKMKLSEEEFYHFDTPCTIDNQIDMLRKAGFSKVENVFRSGNTTILVAFK